MPALVLNAGWKQKRSVERTVIVGQRFFILSSPRKDVLCHLGRDHASVSGLKAPVELRYQSNSNFEGCVLNTAVEAIKLRRPAETAELLDISHPVFVPSGCLYDLVIADLLLR